MGLPARQWTFALAAIAVLCANGVAHATEPRDAGEAWKPHPVSKPRFAVAPPDADPARQDLTYLSADGTRLHLAAWLPAPQGDERPPRRVPVVLVVSPYNAGGGTYPIMPRLVRRGYAYVQADARGTAASGGCFDELGPHSRVDLRSTIEFLSDRRRVPWTDGRIATYGLSQDGGAALRAAALTEPIVRHALRAVVVLAPNVSAYDQFAQDGVPLFAQRPAAPLAAYHVMQGILPSRSLPDVFEHTECALEEGLDQTVLTGDVTPWFSERDIRNEVAAIRTPVLLTRGLGDDRVPPLEDAGLFDRLPSETPKAGFFGLFDHELPNRHRLSGTEELERADFGSVVVAWLDRWLKGRRDTRVGSWPEAQVQGTDGQWRAEGDWPARGRPGQLALSAAGVLGGERPRGSSHFQEGLFETTLGELPPAAHLDWETGPLRRRLELEGTAVADLWLTTNTDDGHLAARLSAFDADGKPIPFGRASGLRSLQHLDSIRRGYFVQDRSRPVEPGRPLHVPLRFQPADIVVPPGGHLRLTLAGSLIVNGGVGELTEFLGQGSTNTIVNGPSQPSFGFSTIEVLHSCEFPSALRFHLPRRRPRLLNVREPHEPPGTPLKSERRRRVVISDGAEALREVCGRAPIAPESPVR